MSRGSVIPTPRSYGIGWEDVERDGDEETNASYDNEQMPHHLIKWQFLPDKENDA